jgi:HAE1 family hydrophobic/amphiphilic exporter-1
MDTTIQKKTLWEFFLHHRRFTIMLLIAGVLIGTLSAISIPRESNPEVDIPIGVVSTVFPGASAEDVEELVTDIVEDKVLGLDDVKTVTSTSQDSSSVVVVEYEANADSDERIRDLKEAIDALKPELPDEAEDPNTQKVRFSDTAIYTLAMSGPYDVSELKQYADTLSDALERIPGVSKVSISGGREDEVHVIVDPALLDKFGLSIQQVTQAISLANTDIPAGSIETAGENYNVRLSGQINSIQDVQRVPITTLGGAPVLVSDVADVSLGKSSITTISRLSTEGGEALPALTLGIFKASGGNIIEITNNVDAKIAAFKSTTLPEDITFEAISKDADYIQSDLSSLATNGISTVLIVMAVLYFFLGWREAVLAGLAIPLSFIFTFIFLTSAGSTLNFLTLFSLILAFGILIDGAVVMTQGMHARIDEGIPAEKAAMLTIRDFNLPLIAGTLTTIFAFLPMLLMSGIMGQFVRHIPITVTLVLMSSLVVALIFIPTLGIYWLKRSGTSKTSATWWKKLPFPSKLNSRRSKISHFLENREAMFDSMNVRYEKYLTALIDSKAKRRRLVWSLVAAFIVSLSLPISGILKVEMFPSEDQDFMFVGIEMPVGTPIEKTDSVAQTLESSLRSYGIIESFSINVGEGAPTDDGAARGEHVASALINLREDRDISSVVFVETLQNELEAVIDADVSVGQYGSGPPSGAPVEIVISGEELETLESVGYSFEALLEDIPGTRDVGSSIQERSGEFVFHIDRAKAQLFGVTTTQVAAMLRNAISGSTATTIRENGIETDVIVKYALDQSTVSDGETNIITVNDIESLTIATPQGDVPIASFANAKLSGTRPVIEHKNGDRVIRVTSYTKSDVSASEVFAEVQSRMKDMEIPDGYDVSLGGEREDITQSYTDMFRAMILAIFLIGGAMVLQFNSFRQPLFILATIPLALIAVFPGLALVGEPLSFPGIIGVVALVGIVVNNAIILIDQINRLRKDGSSKEKAVVAAAQARLEPIILTTVTTVLGMLPITLTNPLWGPLGYSIIFGLTFSTFTTLLVIPLLYNRFAEKEL